jgi:hypothetical protein
MPLCAVVELVSIDFAAERISMDPEQFRGARLIAVKAIQNTLDELLFELVDRFVE